MYMKQYKFIVLSYFNNKVEHLWYNKKVEITGKEIVAGGAGAHNIFVGNPAGGITLRSVDGTWVTLALKRWNSCLGLFTRCLTSILPSTYVSTDNNSVRGYLCIHKATVVPLYKDRC